MFFARLVVLEPCDNQGKRPGGAAVVVEGPQNQCLQGPPPCARGGLCLPRPAFAPIFVGLWWFAASTSICPRLRGQDRTGEPPDAYVLSADPDFSKVVVSCALATGWGSVAVLCALCCALSAAGCCLGVGIASSNQILLVDLSRVQEK